MFIYIHILSYYKLFLYFNLCLSVMLDSLSCSFTFIFFLLIEQLNNKNFENIFWHLWTPKKCSCEKGSTVTNFVWNRFWRNSFHQKRIKEKLVFHHGIFCSYVTCWNMFHGCGKESDEICSILWPFIPFVKLTLYKECKVMNMFKVTLKFLLS